LSDPLAASYDDSPPPPGDGGVPGLSPLQTLLRDRIQDGTLPAPTPDTAYVLFFPGFTPVFRSGSQSCVDWGGYHSSFDAQSLALDGGVAALPYNGRQYVQYAVVVECGKGQEKTFATGHELLEIATDPVKGSGFARRDLVDLYTGQSEVGDLCVLDDMDLENGYTVTRSWSNAAARAGHHPCVPADGVPEFGVVTTVRQQTIGVGETATFELRGYADTPRRPWKLDVTDIEAQAIDAGVPFLSAVLDDPWMYAGKSVTLKVTLAQDASAVYGALPFAIGSHAVDGDRTTSALIIQKGSASDQ
jgi:hypothetical protein